VQPGQLVVIDGTGHELLIDPDEATLARVSRLPHESRRPASPDGDRRRPAVTADDVPIRIEANIEFPDDLPAARYAGADGIGLYRSEFLLTAGTGPTPEDEQYEIYRSMVEGMAPDPVTVRTFDVDEDRLVLQSADSALAGSWIANGERASRLGLRGLRLSLARRDLFRTQLRALLRASRHGSLRIMFPFVSGVEQLREARWEVEQAAREVSRRGEPPLRVPIGVMIEVPAAAVIADLLAPEADFFTIGTNDLIQYCLAVDRADERVSRLYEPLHPAILRIIVMVRRAAARRRIPLSLCGEMASDPALLALLVGLGLREFSMTPGVIGVAKRALSELRGDDLRTMARRILRLPTVAEIESELLASLGRLTRKRDGLTTGGPTGGRLRPLTGERD
jgi:phosphotransferase system enzyme I (PtsI)